MNKQSRKRKPLLMLLCALGLCVAIPLSAGASVVIGGSDSDSTTASDDAQISPQIDETNEESNIEEVQDTFEEEVTVTEEPDIVEDNSDITGDDVLSYDDNTTITDDESPILDDGGYVDDSSDQLEPDATTDDGKDIVSTSTNVHGIAIVGAILAVGAVSLVMMKKRNGA